MVKMKATNRQTKWMKYRPNKSNLPLRGELQFCVFPGSFNGVRMDARVVGIHELYAVIYGQVLVTLITQWVICFPGVGNNDWTWKKEVAHAIQSFNWLSHSSTRQSFPLVISIPGSTYFLIKGMSVLASRRSTIKRQHLVDPRSKTPKTQLPSFG